jgi:hypothetical protein
MCPFPILGDGAILKQILQDGVGPYPTFGQTVIISCSLRVSGCSLPFFASPSLQFLLGHEHIPGLSTSVASMQVGERSSFTIRPEHAYGDSPVDGVPPGSIIEATVELISIPPVFETRDAAAAAALELNEDAGRDFRAGDFAAAIPKYRRALAAFEPFYGAEIDAVTTKIYRNLAASFAKVGDWQQSLHNANRVLQKTPDDLRALARKGDALMALGSIKEAARVVARGLQLSGCNHFFINLQARLVGLEREERARQNALMRKMMDAA